MNRALKNHDDAELRILCEEGYHTRILLSAANRYGIEVREPYHPPSALRIIIGGIATAPMALARPLTLAGEIIATLMFIKLLTAAQRVLAHDPVTRDAVLERIAEICSAGTSATTACTWGRPNWPRPEMVALGAFPVDVLQELPLLTDSRHLPEHVRRQSFVA